MLQSVVRRASFLALATAAGQGIILLVTPWLARQYTPAEFGALALLLSIANISTAIGCLRFDLAILGAPDEDVVPLAKLAMLSAVASSLLGGSIVGVGLAARVRALSALTEVPAPAVLAACCVLAAALTQLLAARLMRDNRFGPLAALRVLPGAGFAVATPTFLGLLWGFAVSLVSGLFAALWGSRWLMQAPSTGRSVREVLRRHWRFPLLSLPGALLDVVGYSLCVWFITSSFGAQEAGRYAQVQRVLGAPLMLASLSLGQVYLRRSAEMVGDPGELRRLTVRLFGLLVLGLGLMLLAIAIAGPVVLGALLGDGWRVDRAFLVAIGVASGVRASVSPVTNVLVTLRRLDLAISWQAGYFCCAMLVLGTASRQVPFLTFIGIYAVHEAVLYTIYLALVLVALRDHADGRPIPGSKPSPVGT